MNLISSKKKKREKKHVQITFALFSHYPSATRTDRIPSGMEKRICLKKKGGKKIHLQKTQPPCITPAPVITPGAARN